MIKAILVLKTNGSCRYYRIYDEKWGVEEKNVEVISYITAVTSIISEFGEKSPESIEFGDNEIVCEAKGEYILTIVKEKGKFENLVGREIIFEIIFNHYKFYKKILHGLKMKNFLKMKKKEYIILCAI